MKFTIPLLTLLIFLFSLPSALADDGSNIKLDKPETNVEIKVYEELERTVVEVAHQTGVVGSDLVGTGQGGGHTVEWSNAVGYSGTTHVQHAYAKTRRVAGSGTYEAETHATLIWGSNYGGTQYFSQFTHACAKSVVLNGTAQTCASPWFSNTPSWQWFIISGHYYDIGANGSDDITCSGCIDFVWQAP